MDPHEPKNLKPPFKMTGERIALLLGGALIGVLIIGFGFKMATPIVRKVCQSILEAPTKGPREARVASVEAVILKPGTISRRITTVGKLRANESVTLRAEMLGRIKEIAFKEGSMVKKGDVLIRFDDEELQAELEKAEADVEYRQVRFARFESLQSKGLGRGTEYDQERGQLNMAKAQLEVAKAKLAKATIYAPFEGKIGLIDVSVGAIVDAQKELVTLVDFDPMKIEFKVPETYIHDIGVGQTAEVELGSIPDQKFQATVEATDSRVDPQTHSIAVRATIPNEDGKLQAGLFGRIGVIIGVKNDALLVPESALGREGDIEYVWVVANGKSGRKRVLTGTKENGQAEITAGLRAGEIVVTSGQLKLGEGTAVNISNMEKENLDVVDEGEEESKPHQEDRKETEKNTGNSPPESPKKELLKPEEQVLSQEAPKPDEQALNKKETLAEPSSAPAEPPQANIEPKKTDIPLDAQKNGPSSPPADESQKSDQSPQTSGKTVTLEAASDSDKLEMDTARSDEEKPHSEPEKSFFQKAYDSAMNFLTLIIHKIRGD